MRFCVGGRELSVSLECDKGMSHPQKRKRDEASTCVSMTLDQANCKVMLPITRLLSCLKAKTSRTTKKAQRDYKTRPTQPNDSGPRKKCMLLPQEDHLRIDIQQKREHEL